MPSVQPKPDPAIQAWASEHKAADAADFDAQEAREAPAPGDSPEVAAEKLRRNQVRAKIAADDATRTDREAATLAATDPSTPVQRDLSPADQAARHQAYNDLYAHLAYDGSVEDYDAHATLFGKNGLTSLDEDADHIAGLRSDVADLETETGAMRADDANKLEGEKRALARLLGEQSTPDAATRLASLAGVQDHAHQLELRYGVELTAEAERGTGREWTESELGQVGSVLERIPEEHLIGNAKLSEIRRVRHVDSEGTAGEYMPETGSALLYDALYQPGLPAPGRIAGDTSALARHDAAGDGPVTYTEELLAHEIGHSVAEAHPELLAKYDQAVGWQRMGGAGLTTALQATGKSDADVKSLRQDIGSGGTVTVGGKTYSGNAEYGMYGAYDAGSIPAGPKWDYARSANGMQEEFAEHYTKAVNVPEEVYQDLVSDPQARTQAALAALEQAKTAGASDQIAGAQAALDQAQKNQQAMQAQFSIMRNDVFHTDSAVDTAASSLAGLPGDAKAREARIARFRQDAERASTPFQVETLRAAAAREISGAG